jgi:hypothetical protein
MIKFKKTKRSFYGKWLYKVSLFARGNFVFRCCNVEDVQNLIFSRLNSNPLGHTAVLENRDLLIRISKFLSGYDQTTFSYRCENNTFDIYTNDEKFFNDTINTFEEILRFAVKPDAESFNLLQNKKNIIVDKYPHNRYKYKVFLLPHRNHDMQNKTAFISWIAAQHGKITLSDAMKKWFYDTRWNWDRRYVLVEDEQTLLMMKLRSSEYVGSIYDYILSDK